MKGSRQHRSQAKTGTTSPVGPKRSFRTEGRPLKPHAIQWTAGEGCGLSLLESWFVATPRAREIPGGGEDMRPIR